MIGSLACFSISPVDIGSIITQAAIGSVSYNLKKYSALMKLHHYYVYSNMDICQFRSLTKVTCYRYSSGVYCPSFLPLCEEYLFFFVSLLY